MQHEPLGSERVGVDTIHPEFVPVLFASAMDQARRIKQLLEQNNIPALLDHDLSGETAYTILPRGIGVLVPDQMHTIASEIVASDEDDSALEEAEVEDGGAFTPDPDEDIPVDDDLADEDPADDDLDEGDLDEDDDDLDDLDDDYDTDVERDEDD